MFRDIENVSVHCRSTAGGPGGPQPAQPSKRLQQTQAQVDEVCEIKNIWTTLYV